MRAWQLGLDFTLTSPTTLPKISLSHRGALLRNSSGKPPQNWQSNLLQTVACSGAKSLAFISWTCLTVHVWANEFVYYMTKNEWKNQLFQPKLTNSPCLWTTLVQCCWQICPRLSLLVWLCEGRRKRERQIEKLMDESDLFFYFQLLTDTWHFSCVFNLSFYVSRQCTKSSNIFFLYRHFFFFCFLLGCKEAVKTAEIRIITSKPNWLATNSCYVLRGWSVQLRHAMLLGGLWGCK